MYPLPDQNMNMCMNFYLDDNYSQTHISISLMPIQPRDYLKIKNYRLLLACKK